MSDFKFNPKGTTFAETVNMDEADLDDFASKVTKISSMLIKNGYDRAEICEEIATTFSYSELVFISSMFIVEKAHAFMQKHPEMLIEVLIEKMFNKKDEE